MKILVPNYTFNAAARTITFTDYAGPGIVLERIFVVSNTTDGILIFNFADPGMTGTVTTNVLTLTYDTTSMSNGDKLCIIYDDPTITAEPVSVGNGSNVVEGKTTDAAVITDATGTIQQYLRGLVKLFITAGSALVTAVCGGDAAHDAADGTTKPIKIGGKAVAWGTTPTAVATSPADRTDQLYTPSGQAFVMPGHPNVKCKEWTVLAADGAKTNAALITPASGKRLIILGRSIRMDVNVSYRLGLAPTTLPAAAFSGADNIFAASRLDAAGSGIDAPSVGSPICIGALDDKCLLTCSSPTAGGLIIILWWIETD